jgi:beta-N-acetylhexosaminidase
LGQRWKMPNMMARYVDCQFSPHRVMFFAEQTSWKLVDGLPEPQRTLQRGLPLIVVAFMLPYDLVAFPEIFTYLCILGILQPSMQALAKAMFGFDEFRGRLPVTIPGLQ